MGTVYRKTATKPLPAGAKIIVRKGQQFAEWKPAKGKTRTAPVTTGNDGTDRIVITARTYTAKYRDGSGNRPGSGDRLPGRIGRPFGTRRPGTAGGTGQGEGADRFRRCDCGPPGYAAGRARRRLLRPPGGAGSDHQGHSQRSGPLGAGDAGLRVPPAGRLDGDRPGKVACGTAGPKAWGPRLATNTAGLGSPSATGVSRKRRLLSNPFAKLPKADVKADRRRQRRALTEAELVKLLDVARRRPLLDMVTDSPGQAKRRSDLQPSARDPPPVGTARARTGVDLQDAGADRASQGRIGFAHRGATGPRRRPAFPGAQRRRRKEPARQLDTASG